ncbi:UNVERIFIED_CONTAM: hypothetical protein GTU68_039646 [Idotea baltica]|nr:hypothetical protein [Idotea baltica]
MKNSSFVIDELKVVANTTLEEFPQVKPRFFENNLKLQNVEYRYPGGEENVLDGINLTIKKGSSIGIIGESGSGKTTLLKILLNLIQQNHGEILIDGHSVNSNNLSSYQKIIGYVEQDIFILNDTIRNNIAFGIEKPNNEKIWEALEQSRLDKFVSELPNGIDMKLGENGVNLSGGQKQRIGIARALYKNSEILCFDEATSALDNETERAIVESINDLSTMGKTVVIVAHRITTLEKCDRIIELSKGKIVREHLYDDLIKEKVLYVN